MINHNKYKAFRLIIGPLSSQQPLSPSPSFIQSTSTLDLTLERGANTPKDQRPKPKYENCSVYSLNSHNDLEGENRRRLGARVGGIS
jgi:hypothetical protein